MWNLGHKTILTNAERTATEMRELHTNAVTEMESQLIKRKICPRRTEYNHEAYNAAKLIVDKFDELKLLLGEV